MQFREDDPVTWTSQAGGCTRKKVGLIAQVVAPGDLPDRKRFPQLYKSNGIGSARQQESYVVTVGRKPYWPRESKLRPAADPLNQVYCPGCGERLSLDNAGCPHCGYADPEHGRILTLREMSAQPSFPKADAARYQDVSPAFIAAVIEAAQSK